MNLFILSTKLMLWLLIVPLVLIFGLMLVAIIIRIYKHLKYYKAPKGNLSYDPEQKEVFLLAFGGIENIISLSKAMNRLSVEVKDIDLVQGASLQELGAKGVLLQGNLVKLSFGERTDLIYLMLKGEDNE